MVNLNLIFIHFEDLCKTNFISDNTKTINKFVNSIMINQNSKILITGAAGFIASCMAKFLNEKGYEQLILCDDFTINEKKENHFHLKCIEKIHRESIDNFLANTLNIDCVIHFGARTDTTEMDYTIHEKWNVNFSKKIWNYCVKQNIPLIYASSAATYGNGEFGYDDKNENALKLTPLNPYGISKNEFDKWVIQQTQQPPNWYGLKFFNVYGPNEFHKKRMASVVFHSYHQIFQNKKITLFRSHNPSFKDGEQKRDFIYVKDILKVSYWLLTQLPPNGIYNLGTGNANTFLNLAYSLFHAMNIAPNIEFIDTPIDIRDKYQYFTEANMQKLRAAGYHESFYSLQEGIKDYVKNYLSTNQYF